MKKKSTFGWAELILGILMIALGIYTFSRPGMALGGAVVLCGIVAVISGISRLLFYFQLERRTGFGPTSSLVSGIFNIIAGILILGNIGAGAWLFTILFPIWFITYCISNLANLGITRLTAGNIVYWLSLICNIIGLFLGFALIFNPYVSYITAGSLIAVYLVLLGVTNAAWGLSLLSSSRR